MPAQPSNPINWRMPICRQALAINNAPLLEQTFLKSIIVFINLKKGNFMKTLILLLISSAAFAQFNCDKNVAYNFMLNYAQNLSLHSGNIPVVRPTKMRVYPNIHVQPSTLNDSMVFVSTGDSSGKEIVGYVEFNRKTCKIVPYLGGVMNGVNFKL